MSWRRSVVSDRTSFCFLFSAFRDVLVKQGCVLQRLFYCSNNDVIQTHVFGVCLLEKYVVVTRTAPLSFIMLKKQQV